MKRYIVKIMKKIYDIIPSKNIKKKIRNKVYFSNKLANIFMYEEKHHLGYKYDNIYTEQIHYYPNKIAINVNVNSTKYFDSIVSLLDEIYYDFDLYLNCSFDFNVDCLLKKLKKNIFLVNTYVINENNNYLKTSLSLTKIDVDKYEYILYINTCANEFEKDELDQLKKQKYIFKNLIYFFKNFNVKIINFAKVNKKQKNFYSKAKFKVVETLYNNNIKFNTFNYGDFENYNIGNISFLETNILKQIDYKNFNDEKLLIDDLEYTFEKVLKLIIDKNKDNILAFDYNNSNFINSNMPKINCKIDKEELKKLLDGYDIVSFDIFDTLVTRKIYNPDDLFKILDLKLKGKYKYEGNFIDIRKKAEIQAREQLNKDVNIDEIYNEIMILTNLSKKQIAEIKQEEINLELEMIIPRKDMLDIYNQLLKKKKKIFLISDMYMPSSIIEKILDNVGIKDYNELWVSCDLNCRKDNGKMWDKLREKYSDEKIMHIGDNNISDVKQALLHEIDAFKLYSGREICQNNLSLNINTLSESVVYGNIINGYLCNSPFSINQEFGYLNINNSYEYGMCVLSPIFIYYFSWLLNKLKENPKQHLLFVSRDGYYLEKMYKYILEKCNFKYLDNIKYDYFLTSRRAASIACAKSKEDLFEILNTKYDGNLKDLFIHRFGVKLDVKNEKIKLPDDIDKVKQIILDNLDIFLKTAEEENENYLKYIETIEENVKDDYLTFIDLGYSGTAQFYISKLLNKRINGNYFLTSENIKPLKLNCHVECCFNKDINGKSDTSNPLYQNALLLESFLTAPYGQLKRFNKKGGKIVPEYINNKNNEIIEKQLNIIFNAITDSFDSLIKNGFKFNDIELNKYNIYEVYTLFVKNINKMPKEIIDLFYIEDFYCCNKVIKAFQ